MGRKREKRRDLPRRLYFEQGVYRYHPASGGAVNLGPDYVEALAQYAKLEVHKGSLASMDGVFDRYELEVIPQKRPRTQRDNLEYLKRLRPVFGKMRPQDVKAQHGYAYMDLRGAPVQANREMSLMTHVMKKAVRWGAVETNPFVGLEKFEEVPRSRCPTVEELEFFKGQASPFIRNYVDFKHITGMRKGDILTLTLTALQDDGIHYTPRKSRGKGKVARGRIIEWSDDLRAVVESIKEVRAKRRRRVAGKRMPPEPSIYLFAKLDGSCYYDMEASRASGFSAMWHRYMNIAIAKAAEQGWTLERFTEHDIRARTGTDAENQGREGHKLLGNGVAVFNKVYNRGDVRVVPLDRGKK